MGDPGHQRIYITIYTVELRNLRRHPVGRQVVAVGQFREYPRQKTGMHIGHGFAEIGNLADIPQQPDDIGGRCPVCDRAVAQKVTEGDLVVGIPGAHQLGARRRHFERFLQPEPRPEIEVGIPPVDPFEGIERVILDRRDHVRVQGADFGNRPERAVRQMTSAIATWSIFMFRPMPMASVATR